MEKHGTKTRRAWRTLHIGTDANTGEIVAATLTGSDACDASQVGVLLDQVPGSIASFTADGAYDWDSAYHEVAARHPDAAVVVLPRSNAVLSGTTETAPRGAGSSGCARRSWRGPAGGSPARVRRSEPPGSECCRPVR